MISKLAYGGTFRRITMNFQNLREYECINPTS